MKKQLVQSLLGLCTVGLMASFTILNLSCKKTDAGEKPNVSQDSTLFFVGNSLTYSNNLPDLVVKIAKTKGRNLKAEMLALPNYALVDHLADGKLQQMMAKNKYSFVIVQQGPSSQAEGRALLLEAAPQLKKLCTDNGAKLAFYMVWPAYANYSTFDGVIRNYTEAATLTQSILCPVGTQWKSHIDNTKDLSYYDTDMFHPSLKGSQVAAEVIYASLFK
jgi:hypothetical protein